MYHDICYSDITAFMDIFKRMLSSLSYHKISVHMLLTHLCGHMLQI